MKITISKSQWEGIGKRTGWIKESQAAFTNVAPKESVIREQAGRIKHYLQLEIQNNEQKLKTIDTALDSGDVEKIKELVKWFWGKHSYEASVIEHEKEL